MSEADILEAMAEAARAAAAVYQSQADRMRPSPAPRAKPSPSQGRSVVDRARELYPPLGFRQAEVIEALEEAGSAAATSAAVSNTVSISEPQAHLTLGTLVEHRLVEKDTSGPRHLYRLSPRLLDGE